jgi:flavodoxin
MKAVVVYDSLSGNTKQIAEVISRKMECKVYSIAEIEAVELSEYDLIVIGTPVHGATPSKGMIKYLESCPQEKKYAIFCTYGAPLWGKSSAVKCGKFIKEKLGKPDVLGEFICIGFHQIFKTYKGHPNADEIKDAGEFGKELMAKMNDVSVWNKDE